MRRKLFPALSSAYRDWLDTGSAAELERTAGKGREHWRNLACDMLDLHAHLGDAAGERIVRLMESESVSL